MNASRRKKRLAERIGKFDVPSSARRFSFSGIQVFLRAQNTSPSLVDKILNCQCNEAKTSTFEPTAATLLGQSTGSILVRTPSTGIVDEQHHG